MPRPCLFLYNSEDRPTVRAVFELAADELRANGHEPWMDQPPGAAEGLHGGAGFEAQIRERISAAGVVFYCVGRAGPGPWQRDREAEFLRDEIARRRSTGGDPLDFIPVLFPDAQLAGFPAWANEYSVVNHDRRPLYPHELWHAMRELLARSPALRGAPWIPEDPDDPVTILHRTVVDADNVMPGLTMFIGPYALGGADGDRDAFGPGEVARDLLGAMRGPPGRMASLALWPSEAAEWTRLDRGEEVVRDVLRKTLGRLETNPPELARGIGELARNFDVWSRRRGGAAEDWHGLLLLTTRLDLGIEARLHAEGVAFTRYLPTVRSARQAPIRRKFTQLWDPQRPWQPAVSPALPVRPSVDLGDASEQAAGADAFHNMTGARSVVVVKLCGSLEVADSLITTTSGFLTAAEGFRALPRRLHEFLRDTPQILLGRGFASPLLQLFRREVLGEGGGRDGRRRFWVMPHPPVGGPGADTLCDLELELLEREPERFEKSLDAELRREEQPMFLRRLAARF